MRALLDRTILLLCSIFLPGSLVFGQSLNITKIAADFERPYIYAVNEISGGEDTLLVISVESGQVVKSIPIGEGVTDMAIHYGEDGLYVTNWPRPTTPVVDLTTQTLLPPLSLGTDVYKINAGRPGRIYYENQDQWVNIYFVNTATGERLNNFVAREGDGEIDPTGQYYYHCENNISNAAIIKYNISSDNPNPPSFGRSREHPYGSRNLILSGDGSRLFWQGYVYDANLNELRSLGEEIYATTLHGDLAFANRNVYNTRTGQKIHTLPLSTTVMAVSGDQTKLFAYDTASHQLVVFPMSDIAPAPGPGTNPLPADRSTIVLPLEKLAWSLNPLALRYQVYFGSDSAAVATADSNSPEYLGSVTAGEIVLSQSLDLGAMYYWRVDLAGFSQITTGPVWSFTVAPMDVSPNRIYMRMITHSPALQANVVLNSDSQIISWNVSESIPWLELNHSSGQTPDTLMATFQIGGLTPGVYTDTLHFTSGSYAFAVPVTLELSAMNLYKMVADRERPYIYALHPGHYEVDDAFLVFISTETNQVVKVLPIGSNPTDMTIHYGENRLYVTNWERPTTPVVDLTTQTLLPPLSLGTEVYKINAGRTGRIYDEEGYPRVDIYIVNTDNGTKVRSIGVQVGDAEIDPTGQYYYHSDNYSSEARITKFNISTDSLISLATSLPRGWGISNLILCGDGSRLFWQDRVYDANLNELRGLGDEIYATTLHGDLAFASRNVYNAHTGQRIHTLPLSTPVMAVSGDQTKLFAFDGVSHELVVFPMSDIAPAPGPGTNLLPTDRSTIILPLEKLAWLLDSLAVRYQVYFGLDSTAVAAADSTSPEYLGSVTGAEMVLPQPLGLGAVYYWRVDLVGFSQTTTGLVWSFTVAPIVVVPNRVYLRMVTHAPDPQAKMALTAGGQVVSWNMSESIPWLELDHSSGQTPDTLAATFHIGGMATGVYTDTLHFTSGLYAFAVPVTLELSAMNISKMAADRERPFIYALHPGSGGVDDAFLLFISTETDQVVKVLPIGSNPTDLTIHYGEDRLYVTNWLRPTTPVVDLTTQTLLPPLFLGTDVYKINAGRPGRIYYEEQDQWINIFFVNTANGERVNHFWAYEGDGEIDPTGNYYYHCENDISNAAIIKYNISSDNPNPPSFGRSREHPYGSRNLILSGDGNRLFWRGYVYDADLTELRGLGDEIYATTLHGDLAFGRSKAYNAHTGDVIHTLPISAATLAVSGDQNKLFAYDAFSDQLLVFPMSDIASIPSPGTNPLPADKSTIARPLEKLSWFPNPLAIRYQVYFSSDSAAVASADSTSPEYLGSVAASEMAFSKNLALGAVYYWRVDQVGFSQTTAGVVWSFMVAPVEVAPNRIYLRVMTNAPDQQATMVLTSNSSGISWSVSESIPWLELNHTSGQTPDSLVATIHVDSLPAGVYTDTLHFSSGPQTFGVPITLELFAMTLSKMAADRERPYIYALHPGHGGLNDAFLLIISTVSDRVVKILPIGSNPTDLTINYGERRLYVTNWLYPFTQVVDLTTQTLLPPLSLGTDVYKINAGRPGRVYYEEEDQWISIYFVNTSNGARINHYDAWEGDGEIDPTGQYYYHCLAGGSDAQIYKFIISSDNPQPMIAASPEHPYNGSRNLILSGDGSRLFWRGYVYDANLNELRSLGDEIYATNLHGELAFGSRNVYNTRTGQVIDTLPLSTTVKAVSGNQTKLFAYDGNSHRLVVIPMSDIYAHTLGDLDGDGTFTVADVVLELNCVFLGTGNCPFSVSDMNCDGQLAPADVVLILNFVFLGVPPPC